MFTSARRILTLATVVLFVQSGDADAQTRPAVRALSAPPASAIFIGNSFFYFNNGITAHMRGLMRGLNPPLALHGTLVGIGGSGFDWHDVESYFRPNAIGSYSFDDNNNVIFNPPGRRLFDIAVLMDCSQCPVHPQLGSVFVDYARRHAQTVRRHGAEPVFFMSWAYKDRPEMTQALAEAYTRAGNESNALVIPAGLAFANAMAERPTLDLYTSDQRHPSLAGTYLATAVTFATIYGRSPEGSRYTAGLDPDAAAFLQRIAAATVRDYFGR